MCLECRLFRTLRLGEDDVFIGKIIAIYADDKCMKNGKPTIRKIDPLIYSTADKKYFRVGKEIGKAYRIGTKVPRTLSKEKRAREKIK